MLALAPVSCGRGCTCALMVVAVGVMLPVTVIGNTGEADATIALNVPGSVNGWLVSSTPEAVIVPVPVAAFHEPVYVTVCVPPLLVKLHGTLWSGPWFAWAFTPVSWIVPEIDPECVRSRPVIARASVWTYVFGHSVGLSLPLNTRVQVGAPRQENVEKKDPPSGKGPPKLPFTLVCAMAAHEKAKSARASAARGSIIFCTESPVQNNWRVIVLVALTPSTVYESTALFASMKLTIADPTGKACTLAGSSGGPKAGPVVRYSVPEQLLPLTVQLGATYQTGLPAPSYTYHARNTLPNWCATAIPQPGSLLFHQRSVKYTAGGEVAATGKIWRTIATVRLWLPSV